MNHGSKNFSDFDFLLKRTYLLLWQGRRLFPFLCYDSLDFYFPFFILLILTYWNEKTHISFLFSWEKFCLNAWVRKKDEYYDFWFFTRSTRPKFIKFGSSINREKSNLEKREDTNSHFLRGGIVSLPEKNSRRSSKKWNYGFLYNSFFCLCSDLNGYFEPELQ